MPGKAIQNTTINSLDNISPADYCSTDGKLKEMADSKNSCLSLFDGSHTKMEASGSMNSFSFDIINSIVSLFD